jgi:hypothetical protein
MAQELLAKLLPHRPKKVLRIGISGPPGGKEKFKMNLCVLIIFVVD